jgi:ariadne-1
MSDEEEWSDDYIWEENEPLLELKRAVSYEIIQQGDIVKRQVQAIDKLSEELGLSYTQAAVFLMQTQWNPQRVIEKIMNNSLSLPDFIRASSKVYDDKDNVTCILCFNIEIGSNMRALECNHAFCLNCYTEYLKETVDSGVECIFTKCPMSDCEILVPQELFEELLPQKVLDKYKMFVIRSYVDKRTDVKWCPAPDCTSAACYPKKSAREIVCNCGYSWCFGCGKDSHRPLSCELLKKWEAKITLDDNEQWLLVNTKTCPQCSNAIQKNLGCMHMTCKCGHQFCWLCLGKWSEHNEKTGGNYQCNKFKMEQAQGKYKEEENKRAVAAYSMQKFEHYYNRYLNHKSSLDQAKAKHKTAVDESIDMYKNIKESLIFDFFTEATDLLISTKKSLAYSYALGFYLTSTCKINFYEFIQGELELNMIRLDNLTDISLLRYLEVTEDCYILSNQFAEDRLQIINLTQVVKSFFNECLSEIENGFPNIKDSYEDLLNDEYLSVAYNFNYSDKWICGACTYACNLNESKCPMCQTSKIS